MLASARLFPKFVSNRAAMYHELGNGALVSLGGRIIGRHALEFHGTVRRSLVAPGQDSLTASPSVTRTPAQRARRRPNSVRGLEELGRVRLSRNFFLRDFLLSDI